MFPLSCAHAHTGRKMCAHKKTWSAHKCFFKNAFAHISHRVSVYMRNILHWLHYPQCSVYCISALVQCCIEGLAPSYLRELCCPTVTIQRCISLRFSALALLLVPQMWTAT